MGVSKKKLMRKKKKVVCADNGNDKKIEGRMDSLYEGNAKKKKGQMSLLDSIIFTTVDGTIAITDGNIRTIEDLTPNNLFDVRATKFLMARMTFVHFRYIEESSS